MNEVFANCTEEDKIYPLTTAEIVEAQKADTTLKHHYMCSAIIDQGLEIRLIANTTCVCKDGKLVIPKPLQVGAFKWYHQYLQHPGHTRLKETMKAAMYWKGMCTTIRSITRSCRTCQTNKRWKLKFGLLLSKTVISNSWECLCINLIGPYTLKGNDNSQIDFMDLTMIRHASSWFEIVELPIINQLSRQTVNGKELLIANKIFDKTLDCIAKLVY